MNHRSLLLLLSALLLLVSCRSHKSAAEQAAGKVASCYAEIPYTVAKGYFLKNNVNSFSYPVIDSEREFKGLFGAATTMGPDGQPTPIDFKKYYVVAVSLPDTDVDTDITPVSLYRSADGLTFNYRVKRGDARSYTIRPLLLLLVERRYSGEVTPVEIK